MFPCSNRTADRTADLRRYRPRIGAKYFACNAGSIPRNALMLYIPAAARWIDRSLMSTATTSNRSRGSPSSSSAITTEYGSSPEAQGKQSTDSGRRIG